MRTIQIHTEKPEEIGFKDYFQALGHLADWASERYPFVNITPYEETGLIAVYSLTLDGQSRYVIAAVWDGTKYTFHS